MAFALDRGRRILVGGAGGSIGGKLVLLRHLVQRDPLSVPGNTLGIRRDYEARDA